MKVVVVQTGARHGYAIPAILERSGMLERFYTDMCGNVGLGRILSKFKSLPRVGPAAARLANRKVPETVIPKTMTFAFPTVRRAFESRADSDPATYFHRQNATTERFGRALCRAGFGKATHLLTMLGEAGPLMAEAKRQGLSVISDIYILLSAERLMSEERFRFPEWEPGVPDWHAMRRKYLPDYQVIADTDFFVCPSQAVRDDLVSHWGVTPPRTVVVPYGVDPKWFNLQSRPERGRILFVGTAELRKGIHYLAMAADQLRQRGRRYEFRIAGDVSKSIREHPMCSALSFLGRVPRSEIQGEFEAADAVVLPSLAEGSAGVTYEALAAGIPLITTAASGSVARHGIEALIVPERDETALANAIESVVEDRDLHASMAKAGPPRAREYTWEKYSERLIAALRGCNAARSSPAADDGQKSAH